MPVLRIVSFFNQSEIMFSELTEIRIPDNVAWADFQNAVHLVVASKLGIPARFVVLVWPAECARDSPQAACSTVGVVLSPPEHHIPQGDGICFCCAEPCANASHVRHNAVGSCEWNCMTCEPMFLCTSCRIQLRPGVASCLYCLTLDEAAGLNEVQMRRWSCVISWCDSMESRESSRISPST